MYKTYTKFILKDLPIPLISSFGIVIDIKITKANTSFLVLFFRDIHWKGGFSVYRWTLYLKEVFLFFFDCINTSCKRFLFTITIIPRVFLVETCTLVFFISLVGRRLLLPIRYVNKRGVSELILFRVFILLFG